MYYYGGEIIGWQDEFQLQNIRFGIMLCQFLDGELQDVLFVCYVCFCQLLVECWFVFGQGQFVFEDVGVVWWIVFVLEWFGGVQVEGGQMGIVVFFFVSEEKVVVVGEGQQVVDCCLVLVIFCDLFGEQVIEQVVVFGGKEV